MVHNISSLTCCIAWGKHIALFPVGFDWLVQFSSPPHASENLQNLKAFSYGQNSGGWIFPVALITKYITTHWWILISSFTHSMVYRIKVIYYSCCVVLHYHLRSCLDWLCFPFPFYTKLNAPNIRHIIYVAFHLRPWMPVIIFIIWTSQMKKYGYMKWCTTCIFIQQNVVARKWLLQIEIQSSKSNMKVWRHGGGVKITISILVIHV